MGNRFIAFSHSKTSIGRINAALYTKHYEMSRMIVFDSMELFRREKALQKYSSGKISISEAAKHAGMNLWEFEGFAVAHGFKSSYSIEDLERELK
ncbi:UPF0175 family protein [Candidatus Micrarchaeota archaeon]|nr:UPF0175 family protein [Candidatus Micrarchaeota archaeon]